MTLAPAETSVVLHLLDHTRKSQKKERFWINWSKEWRRIEESKTIRGTEADLIIELLRESLLAREALHFCGHNPVYGIVAKSAEGQVIKTSLCFKCSTWVLPNKRLSITGPRGTTHPLCKLLRTHIELPKELLTPQKDDETQ